MTKVLCTLAVGPHRELLAITRPTFEGYAERHGYELIVETERRSERPAPWDKLPILIEALQSAETVVWIDSDAVIVEDRFDVSVAARDAGFALVKHHMHGRTIPNTGVMVLREPAVEILEESWERQDFLGHSEWEQAAVHSVLERRGWPVSWLSKRWNSVPDDPSWRPRIMHFAGRQHSIRASAMAVAAKGRSRDLAAMTLMFQASAAKNRMRIRAGRVKRATASLASR